MFERVVYLYFSFCLCYVKEISTDMLEEQVSEERYTELDEEEDTIRLVPAQDGPFFYTRSHLSALQNCALLFSTNFQFIFIFKNA